MDGAALPRTPAAACGQDGGARPGAGGGAGSGAAVAEGAAHTPAAGAQAAARRDGDPSQGLARVSTAAAAPAVERPAAGPGAGCAAGGPPAPGPPGRQLPPSILCQTAAALGLWEQLHDTASTPSTVLAPGEVRRRARAANSLSTNQSAT